MREMKFISTICLLLMGTILALSGIIFSPESAHAATSYLACCATNTLTNSATWKLVDATSYNETENSNLALTASYVPASPSSAGYIPAAGNYDGIGVKVYSRSASAVAQTFSVTLYKITAPAGAVAGTEITIKVTDLPLCAGGEVGWVFFRWASPVALDGTSSYIVQAKTSATTMVNLYKVDSGTGNATLWTRYLRTTTAQAPVASDVMIITREYTGSTTGNSYTVTMDQTANTDYGLGTDALTALSIGNGCHLTYDITKSTYLKLSGNLIVYAGGYLDIGTIGSEIPRAYTAVLEFDPVADGGMGLIVRQLGYLNMQGLSRTAANTTYKCKLNTDEAVNSTSLGVDTVTGWLDNDQIAIATTTRTYSQCETGLLNGNAAADTLTVDGFGGAGGGLAYAHTGSTPGFADVILLTRNIKFRAATSSLVTYLNCKTTSTVDIDWVEFYWTGQNTAAQKSIEVETTTGSFSMQYCSIHDTEDYGFCTTGTSTNNIVFSNNVLYNTCTATIYPVYVVATSGTAITLDNNVVMLSATGSNVGFYILDAGLVFTNNTVSGINGVGINDGEAAAVTGTFSGNTAYGNASYGAQFNSADINSTFATLTCWRNNARGLYISASLKNCIFSNFVGFGNTTSNIYIASGADITFTSPICSSETAYTTTNGLETVSPSQIDRLKVTSGSFGVVATGKIAHTNDINIGANTSLTMLLTDTYLASGVEVLGNTGLIGNSYVKSDNNDNAGNKDRTWTPWGSEENEVTIFKTAAPSFEQTPASAATAMTSDPWLIPCDAAEAVTVTIWVRWDSSNTPGTLPSVALSGEGSAPATDTSTQTTTNWCQLSVTTTPATKGFLVLTPSCLKSSSATLVYWDDIATTYANGGSKSLGGMDYWYQALPKYLAYAIATLQRTWGTIVGM